MGALIGTLLLAGVALAQDRDVAALLDRIPATSLAERDALQAAMNRASLDDVKRLCALVVEPGKGDDSKVRTALHGIAAVALAPGHGELQARFVTALATMLGAETPVAVKTFLISELQFGGGERAVEVLASSLTDPELCGPAVRALLAISPEAAANAFRDALPQTSGSVRIALIDALGRLRDRAAIATLLELAKDENERVRLASASALAAIGAGEIEPVLRDAFDTDSWYQLTQWAAALLGHADRLAQSGERERASAIYKKLLNVGETHATPIRIAALYGLSRSLGVAAVDDVVAALTSDNIAYRTAAADIAASLRGAGVLDAFSEQLDNDRSEVRAAVLGVLRRRGEGGAFGPAVLLLGDADKRVRLAAVDAVAALGESRAVKPLVRFLDTRERDEVRTAQHALTRIAADVSGGIAGALETARPRVRAALLEVLADRGALDQVDAIFAYCNDADEPVRVAAVSAIGVLGDERVVAHLLSLLTRSNGANERDALENALAECCKRASTSANKAAPILAALDPEHEHDYASLLRVLGRIGGRAAFDAVRDATRDARAPVRDAAYHALGDWPQASVANEMLTLARDAKELNPHVLTLRAYARLVAGDASLSVPRKLAAYQAAMDVTRRADEKRLLLSRIGGLRDARAFDLLERYVDDKSLAAEAASAIIRVSEAILPGEWRAARDALVRTGSKVANENVRERADAVLARIALFEDFITEWRVAGPYTVRGKAGNEILETPFAPERSLSDVEWKPQPVTTDPARYWFIDLNQSVGGDNRVGYLFTRVYSPDERPIKFELGSDDGIRVWLNGKMIHSNNALRGCERAQDTVNVKLHKGWNDLLVKISNNGGGFAACVRIRNTDGRHSDGVYAQAADPPRRAHGG